MEEQWRAVGYNFKQELWSGDLRELRKLPFSFQWNSEHNRQREIILANNVRSPGETTRRSCG